MTHNQDVKLEEGIVYMCDRRKKFESQGESIQDGCKVSNDLRCRYLGSEEITREVVACGGNEDVQVDEWSHQAVEPLFYRFKNV